MTRPQLQFALSPILALVVAFLASSGAPKPKLIDTTVTQDGRRISLVQASEALSIVAEVEDGVSTYSLPLDELLPGETLLQAALAPWTHVHADGAAVAVASEIEGFTYYRFLVRRPGEQEGAAWYVSPKVFATTEKPFKILNMTTGRGDGLRITFQRGRFPYYENPADVQILEFGDNCVGGKFTRGKSVLVDARSGKQLEFGVVL